MGVGEMGVGKQVPIHCNWMRSFTGRGNKQDFRRATTGTVQ